MSSLSRSTIATLSIVLLIALFLAINVFSNVVFRSSRLDLTEDSLFTLSQGTKNVLRQIEEPITLKLYYSEEIAVDFQQIHVLAERVQDLLSEFSNHAGGRLLVEVINPEPYTEAEDEAVASGLLGAPTGAGDVIYFGLVGVNTIDGREIIPFFAPEREQFLEYDIASMLYRLNTEEQPTLGVVSGLPLETGTGGLAAAMRGETQPFMIYERLVEQFDIENLEAGFDRIDPEIEVLLLAHPTDLTQASLYAVDQFVLRGGKVLAFADPYSELSSASQGAFGQPTSPAKDNSTYALTPLLEAWGVSIDSAKIVGDLSSAIRVGYGQGSDATSIDYVLWLGLDEEAFNKSDLATADLSLIQLGSTGAVTPVEDASTMFTPLISSSTNSQMLDYQDAKFQTPPDELLISFEPDVDRHVIAARISGPVVSAFPDGPPADIDEADDSADDAVNEGSDAIEEPLPDHLGQSVRDANIIVVADSDLFDDRFWVQVQIFLGQRIPEEMADNATFVVNAIETLMGSSDLISLRSRSRSQRPFTRVEDIRRKAEIAFLPKAEELDRKLDEIVRRVDAIRGGAAPSDLEDDGVVVTADQRVELQRLLAEAAAMRKSKRDIQYNLRADVDRLGTWLKMINIVLLPFLVATFAIGVSVFRVRMRRQRQAVGGR